MYGADFATLSVLPYFNWLKQFQITKSMTFSSFLFQPNCKIPRPGHTSLSVLSYFNSWIGARSFSEITFSSFLFQLLYPAQSQTGSSFQFFLISTKQVKIVIPKNQLSVLSYFNNWGREGTAFTTTFSSFLFQLQGSVCGDSSKHFQFFLISTHKFMHGRQVPAPFSSFLFQQRQSQKQKLRNFFQFFLISTDLIKRVTGGIITFSSFLFQQTF